MSLGKAAMSKFVPLYISTLSLSSSLDARASYSKHGNVYGICLRLYNSLSEDRLHFIIVCVDSR